MVEAPVGVAIPIEFRTNKIRKAVTLYDEAPREDATTTET